MLNGFRSAVIDCDLHDVPLEGYQFTWSRWKGSDKAVEERLDRAMVTPSWKRMFPYARLGNLIASISDHAPILLCTDRTSVAPRRKFHFENRWLKEPSLAQVVQHGWENSSGDLLIRLGRVSMELEVWGHAMQRRFKGEIDQCKKCLEKLRFKNDQASVDLYVETRNKLAELLLEYEIF